jgi:hypothetical protein
LDEPLVCLVCDAPAMKNIVLDFLKRTRTHLFRGISHFHGMKRVPLL